MSGDIRDLLVCPICGGALLWEPGQLSCRNCSHRFQDAHGTRTLVVEDVLDAHKREQAAYVDGDVDEEWETTRPNGAPRFHTWLITEKFKRSVSLVQAPPPSGTAVVSCAGSGMDAEFLARLGWSVIATDISGEAVRRAQTRASRAGLAIVPIGGDAERLPLGDQSVDLAYVHDGLHHLSDPLVGLRELMRVSRRYVSISEPARSPATRLAVSLGIAVDVEDAGNTVARLTEAEVIRALREGGFEILSSGRYAMFYRHHPGWVSRLLSAPGVFYLGCAGWRTGNAILNHVGNKLAVIGVRSI